MKSTSKYKLSLKLGNTTYESTGSTILEALTSLKRPEKIVTKGILTIENGERKNVTTLMPMQVKRLFFPLAQYIQAKYMEVRLK